MGESPVQPDIVVSGFQTVALVVPKKYDYLSTDDKLDDYNVEFLDNFG